ncbi:MAG: phosphoglucosamine mutase [Bacilli bacterium]|jgi:phosphoglucosamine mutase|nr:phosphoglucosamine mutase [Bacilli bacterium]
MKYFGTDGIRGIANKELTCEIAFKLGQYLGYKFTNKNILIGSDTRLSKDMLEASLCAGITSMGANAYLAKIISTPGVSYLVKNNDFIGGIMISASHNPYYDNGLKVFNENGVKISESLELEIEDYLDNKIKLDVVDGENLGQVFDYTKEIDSYLTYLASTINVDLSKMNIIVDTANGSASKLANLLFDKLNINYKIINSDYNGKNINLNCGSTHLEELQKKVKEGNYDLGIAFDGDADRMLAIASNGDIIDGDYIIYICAKYLASTNRLNKDTVVCTIMANMGLFKALDKLNIKYEKTQVGDKYVYEVMEKENYQLGGEQSGHIIFKEFASTGDGMLSALQLMAALSYLKTDAQSIMQEVTIFPQVLKNVKVKDKKTLLKNQNLLDEVSKVENELANEGRVLLRASGTEPLVRVMVEASSIDLCNKYVDYLVSIVEELDK